MTFSGDGSCWCCFGRWDGPLFRLAHYGSVHRLLVGSFDPVMIVLPLKVTQHFSLSKITSHPALHRIRILSRDAIFISGTMCLTKVCGRPGMMISHVCVDVIRLPSGRLILIGLHATQMLFAGAPAMMKIDVAPVSVLDSGKCEYCLQRS